GDALDEDVGLLQLVLAVVGVEYTVRLVERAGLDPAADGERRAAAIAPDQFVERERVAQRAAESERAVIAAPTICRAAGRRAARAATRSTRRSGIEVRSADLLNAIAAQGTHERLAGVL